MRTRRLLALTTSILLAAAASVTHAKGFDYTYGQIGYQNWDSDSIEYQGASVDISFGALDFMHILLGYSRFWVDNVQGTSDDDIDIDEFRLGAGGNFSLLDNLDLVGRGIWIYQGESGDSNNANIGYEVEAGVRWKPIKTLELAPSLYYYDNDDFEADIGAGLGVVYNFKKRYSLSVQARYFDDDEVTDLFAGIRYRF
jgi:hypothetical protein